MTKTSMLRISVNQSPVRVNGKMRFLVELVLAGAVIFPRAGAAASPAPVDLRSVSRFAILAGSAITSVPMAAIKGDVGLSPSARSKITGLTAVEVTGTIFAADDGGAVAVMLTQAKVDLDTAYNDAAGRTLAPVDVANADLGGRTLAPGLYKSSGMLAITGNLTLDAQGDPNAVFIFQMASSLNTAPGSQVILSGGASAGNIFWQVGSSATLGTTTIFKGIILADQSISMATRATLDGRALARIGAVTLDANAITIPTTATASVILVSSAEVAGPYANAAGHSVNYVTKTITASTAGNTQYYRILSDTALRIKSVDVSGRTVVISYN